MEKSFNVDSILGYFEKIVYQSAEQQGIDVSHEVQALDGPVGAALRETGVLPHRIKQRNAARTRAPEQL